MELQGWLEKILKTNSRGGVGVGGGVGEIAGGWKKLKYLIAGGEVAFKLLFFFLF